jgi:2-dehydropantoate 2-reductase
VVAGTPDEIDWRADDVAMLAVKCQDTVAALRALATVAPADLHIVCAQNGVVNEAEALRWFRHVHGLVVMCPTAHLHPGLVVAYSHPVPGILDIGRWPTGIDDTSVAVSMALRNAGFESRPIDDLARWKWAKLVTNLGNAIEAVCGPPGRAGRLAQMVTAEGYAVLDAAGIDHASEEEDRRRRGDILDVQPVDGVQRPGGSTWQSLSRHTAPETDLLNGEIVRIARLHGSQAPLNEVLQRLVRELAAAGSPPGTIAEADVLAEFHRRTHLEPHPDSSQPAFPV